jgi:hypothetical protein
MNNFTNRRWIFLDSSDLDQVDFDQLPLVNSGEGKPTSLRYCHDKSKFMIRYDIENVSGVISGRPDCYDSALNISGQAEWEHEPVLEYLATEEWTNTGMFPTGEMT